MQMTKICKTCKEVKPIAGYYKQHKHPHNPKGMCKSCDNAVAVARSKTPAERTKRAVRRKSPEALQYAREYGAVRHDTPSGRARYLVANAKKRASNAGVAFDLTIDFVHSRILFGECELTGLKFDLGPSLTRVNPRAPSLDRIDPGGPYTQANTRLVCWQVNLALCEYGQAAFEEMVKAAFKTISSQASKEEGSTTIPQGSRTKWSEAHSTLN